MPKKIDYEFRVFVDSGILKCHIDLAHLSKSEFLIERSLKGRLGYHLQMLESKCFQKHCE